MTAPFLHEDWAHQFDPTTDVAYDAAGLLQFTGTKPGLEADVTRYFAQRDEDGLGEGH